MNLNDAELGKEYVIKDVDTFGDDDMKSFLKTELSLLSKYRVSIMGIAAIMIMVFHTSTTSDYERN